MRSILVAATVIAIGGAAFEAGAEPVIEGNTIEGVRNARYCEIIPIVREGLHLKATVYNTLGLNDCPSAIWDTITEDAMKQRFGALIVLLNGPRYFIMGSIAASGVTRTGETIEAGGLKLTVVNACRKFQCRSALIDGEVIVQDKNGVSDFAASPHVMIWSQGGAGCMPAPSQIRT